MSATLFLVLPYDSGDHPEFDSRARPSALKDKLRHDNPLGRCRAVPMPRRR